MKTCAYCKKEFKGTIIIDGKVRNLKNRKLCLECSPFGCHNTRPVTRSMAPLVSTEPHKCAYESCSAIITTNNKFCCEKCSMKYYVNAHRRRTKEKAIEYKGGKCSICGYNTCVAALQFHHLDPKEKEFSLSHDGHARKWETVKQELDKCILVCANCHAEIHNGNGAS